MEAIFGYAVVLFIILRVINKRKKTLEGSVNEAKTRQGVAKSVRKAASVKLDERNAYGYNQKRKKSSGVNPDMPAKSSGVLRKDGKVSSSLRDDRMNDWLANQMREERNSLYRLREMFGFKMEGRNITDAELLKEFHLEHCNADGVDLAKGK